MYFFEILFLLIDYADDEFICLLGIMNPLIWLLEKPDQRNLYIERCKFGNFDITSKIVNMEDEVSVVQNTEIEKKISNYIKGIKLTVSSSAKTEDVTKKIRSNELFQLSGEHPMDELAGVCIDDVHYYDFKNVQFINNTGMASLIDLLKCLLLQGVKVQFVNVNERIKNKIKLMGLDNILNCS